MPVERNFNVKNGLQVNSIFSVEPLTGLINATANVNITGVGNFSIGANVGANVNITPTNIQIGNTTVNTQANSSLVSTGTGNFSTGANVGSNVNLTTTGLSVGNSTVNTQANSSLISTGTLNVASINTTTLFMGNSTVNAISNSIIDVFNSSTTANLSINGTAVLFNGNSTVNSVHNAMSISMSANLLINSSMMVVGNSTVNVQVNSSTVLISGNAALANNTTATIGAGYTINPYPLGNIASSFTANAVLGNYQYGNNHVASTWSAPSSDCAITILVINDATAGAITFSGFTVGSSTGDTLTTTSGNKFLISIIRINSISTYAIKALQ